MADLLKIDFDQIDSQEINSIRSALQSGEVIAFPTDTFYGLGADPFNPEAVSRIFQIKQRPADKPLLVLIHSINQLAALTREVTDNARQLMDRFWPGPLTLIFEAAPDLPDILTADTGTVGIRLPAHAFTQQLLKTLDHPLTAPSANISGGPELLTAQDVEQVLGDALDIIVDDGAAPGGALSTVLDTTTRPPTLIREGAVSLSELESALPIQTR